MWFQIICPTFHIITFSYDTCLSLMSIDHFNIFTLFWYQLIKYVQTDSDKNAIEYKAQIEINNLKKQKDLELIEAQEQAK